MITIFVEKHEEYKEIYDEAVTHWSRFGKVVGFTQKTKDKELLFVTDINDLEEYSSTDLYIVVDSAWRLTGINEIPLEPCSILFCEGIEYHRYDRYYRLIPFVRSVHEVSIPQATTQGKIYNTIGKVLKKTLLPTIDDGYFKLLQQIKFGDIPDTINDSFTSLSDIQKLTLIEHLLIHNYDFFEKNMEWLRAELELIHSPHTLLCYGIMDFLAQKFISSKEKLASYNLLDPLEISFDWEYDIFIRRHVAYSYLLRIAMIESDFDAVEKFGRLFYNGLPSKLGYESNRFLLRNFFLSHGIGYDNIELFEAPSQHQEFVPFIVYTQPRSGSTLLCSELNSHPDISCMGELLSGEEALEFLDKEELAFEYIVSRELDAARLYEDILQQVPGSVRGFKLHGCQFDSYANQPAMLEKILAHTPKIIYLRRTPDIRRAISLSLAFTNEHFRRHPEFAIFDKVERVDYFKSVIATLDEQDRKYLELMERQGCQILEIDMYDYIHNRDKNHRAICTFLGVKKFPMNSNIQKQNIWKTEEILR